MFQKFLNFIRKQVMKIFSKETIKEGIGIDIAISEEMAKNIDLWTKMYEDEPPWTTDGKIKSLGLAGSIASEMARLVTIEMESEITGSERAEYLNSQYQRVVDVLRIQTEYGLAKGGLVFKPYVDGESIAIDYVQADNFYPVAFNSSGDLIGAIFPEIIKREKNIYTRLEYHHLLPNGVYYISNTAFIRNENIEGLGMEIPLTEVEEWKDLEPEINLYGLTKPLFSYFKVPLANNKDSTSKLGVSIYSRAEKLIKQADRQYTSILWEYEGTELAIDAALDMFTDNNTLPEGRERIFRKLDTEDEHFYQVFSPDIRDESLFNGLNAILRKIEFNCGLAYGTLSDLQVVEKTAEEIKTSKQRSYATIVDIQKSLRISLEHLIESMDYLATFYNLAPKGEYEVSFTFDDSIIVDTKSEVTIMMQEVAAGLIKPELYLMYRYGVDEERAKEMIPNPNPPQGEFDDIE